MHGRGHIAGHGSSPLARGLHAAGVGGGRHLRIIPARAGFTPDDPPGRRRRGDHPRSRGVYRTSISPPFCVTGSSPLARGLQTKGRLQIASIGIIPARAGFTSSTWSPTWSTWDHPRSRGVYAVEVVLGQGACGSSPLARGLLPRRRPPPGRHRIIPARAGFTHAGGRHRRRRRDHPRSRGVYRTDGRRRQGAAGSSPLARGLRCSGGALGCGGGIIPARAGFTIRDT